MKDFEQEIKGIITAYNKLIQGIEAKALDKESSRAYGGVIRAGKGKLTEGIAQQLVRLAWLKLGGKESRLGVPEKKKKFKIPIKSEYVEKIKDKEIKEHIKQKVGDYYFALGSDVQVFVDGELVMVIECKAYTENAMMKRILVDFTLIKNLHPNIISVLMQLESQLGGDFSELKKVSVGSPSTHTLLSYFDIDLNIITLLKGERKVDEPIHKKKFYKPLTKENLVKAIDKIAELLKEFV
jgi:hypothetical protein